MPITITILRINMTASKRVHKNYGSSLEGNYESSRSRFTDQESSNPKGPQKKLAIQEYASSTRIIDITILNGSREAYPLSHSLIRIYAFDRVHVKLRNVCYRFEAITPYLDSTHNPDPVSKMFIQLLQQTVLLISLFHCILPLLF